MGSKWQKNIAIGVMILVVVLILVKLVYNYKVSWVIWEDGDRDLLINSCIEDLGSRSVRFPKQTQEYCGCFSDAMMQNFSKAEYEVANSKSNLEQQEEMLPVILDCYNLYQEAMFKASKID
ncbi:MAG: hypothetical protein COA58_11030 [Bacteroidetes bacterium]|nr:MAG: hypothetical protein COA58_11030 [Bacteroidota bacterium]